VHPIRFATGLGRVIDRPALVRAAQAIERCGFSTVTTSDHFAVPFSPLLALQAVADATTTLRLTQTVLNQDLRHPAVLAKDLATLDVLSGGRLEIGLGAGWMRSEYEQAGIRFDPAPVRIERLAEVVTVLEALFGEDPVEFAGRHFTIAGLTGRPTPVQRPHPPIMIGGGGRRLLSVAGRLADIVQLMPRSGEAAGAERAPFSAETYAEKVGWVREAAGARFDAIELAALLLDVQVTDDPGPAYERFAARLAERLRRTGAAAAPSVEQLRDAPMLAIGTLDEVCAKLTDTRDRLGISYFCAPAGADPAALAPVIARLSGR
jgi:probable F420-dependent oxidoreductase